MGSSSNLFLFLSLQFPPQVNAALIPCHDDVTPRSLVRLRRGPRKRRQLSLRTCSVPASAIWKTTPIPLMPPIPLAETTVGRGTDRSGERSNAKLADCIRCPDAQNPIRHSVSDSEEPDKEKKVINAFPCFLRKEFCSIIGFEWPIVASLLKNWILRLPFSHQRGVVGIDFLPSKSGWWGFIPIKWATKRALWDQNPIFRFYYFFDHAHCLGVLYPRHNG